MREALKGKVSRERVGIELEKMITGARPTTCLLLSMYVRRAPPPQGACLRTYTALSYLGKRHDPNRCTAQSAVSNAAELQRK